MFNPLFDDLEQMERLAAEVIPASDLAAVHRTSSTTSTRRVEHDVHG